MNLLKKGEGVPLLNFEEGPGILLLNFEGDPGVPLLNFKGSWVSLLNFEGVPVLGPRVLVPLLHHANLEYILHNTQHIILLFSLINLEMYLPAVQ